MVKLFSEAHVTLTRIKASGTCDRHLALPPGRVLRMRSEVCYTRRRIIIHSLLPSRHSSESVIRYDPMDFRYLVYTNTNTTKGCQLMTITQHQPQP